MNKKQMNTLALVERTERALTRQYGQPEEMSRKASTREFKNTDMTWKIEGFGEIRLHDYFIRPNLEKGTKGIVKPYLFIKKNNCKEKDVFDLNMIKYIVVDKKDMYITFIGDCAVNYRLG